MNNCFLVSSELQVSSPAPPRLCLCLSAAPPPPSVRSGEEAPAAPRAPVPCAAASHTRPQPPLGRSAQSTVATPRPQNGCRNGPSQCSFPKRVAPKKSKQYIFGRTTPPLEYHPSKDLYSTHTTVHHIQATVYHPSSCGILELC